MTAACYYNRIEGTGLIDVHPWKRHPTPYYQYHFVYMMRYNDAHLHNYHRGASLHPQLIWYPGFYFVTVLMPQTFEITFSAAGAFLSPPLNWSLSCPSRSDSMPYPFNPLKDLARSIGCSCSIFIVLLNRFYIIRTGLARDHMRLWWCCLKRSRHSSPRKGLPKNSLSSYMKTVVTVWTNRAT